MREPVGIAGAASVILTTAVALAAILWPGRLTPELTAGIVALGNAVIGLITILFARSKVTPVAAPKLPIGTPVLVEGTDDQPPPDAVVAPVVGGG